MQEIIRRYTGDKGVVIREDTDLITDLGLNSFELVEVMYGVEEMFNIEIPDRTITSFRKVRDVLDYFGESSL